MWPANCKMLLLLPLVSVLFSFYSPHICPPFPLQGSVLLSGTNADVGP